MKNLKIKLLTLGILITVLMSSTPAFAATTKTNVASSTSSISETLNQKTTIDLSNLKDGEKVKVPLVSTKTTQPGTIQPDTYFPGNIGYVCIWRSGNKVYYEVEVGIPATSFNGSINITDLSSGLSAGVDFVDEFSGSVRFSNYTGHRYSASIYGHAYLGPVSVATTVPNWITWVS